MLNRHGLIAGATGTGKTKPAGHPVEYLSLSGKLGPQVRAIVHSFGPLLLGKVLDLNETQTSILALVFKYCDDNDLPLLDLKDLAATLKYLSSDEGKPILADYGGMSSASVGVLLRSMIVLEQEGADVFFGEPEFEVEDLLRITPEGEGIISILELSDVMDQPRLFSTFMLWMLAQLYESLPEAGDLPKPKLCFFFDEAHLLFHDASEALMDQVERTARLIANGLSTAPFARVGEWFRPDSGKASSAESLERSSAAAGAARPSSGYSMTRFAGRSSGSG